MLLKSTLFNEGEKKVGAGGGWWGWSRMLNSEFNILLDLFVWSRPKAIIRSTFSTECRKASKRGAWRGSWRGFRSAEDPGTEFFFWGERNEVVGGDERRDSRALESGGNDWRAWGGSSMWQPASVSLLLKVIYQRVSSCNAADLADFDWSNSYWKMDCCHWRVFICGNHLLDGLFNDIWFWWECQWIMIKIRSAVGSFCD